MLSDYQFRKLKRQQKRAEYNQLVQDQKLISREKLVCEYEAAYLARYGVKPKRFPANKQHLRQRAMKLQAQLHNEEFGYEQGLGD